MSGKRIYAWRWDKPVAFDVVKEWTKQLDIQATGFSSVMQHRIRTAQIGVRYFATPEEARDAEVMALDRKIESKKNELQRLRSLRGTVASW